MRKIKNPWTRKEGYDCFGCCPDNPIGIHMEFYEDGDDIVDETAGWVVFRKLQTSGMTTKLELRYKHPVMTTEAQITVRGHIAEQRRNIVSIDVKIENSKGEVCVEGHAVYFAFDKAKAREMGFTSCDLEGDELLSM